MVDIDTNDVRHVAELGTDVAALLYGLQAVGITPLDNLSMINPADPILGVIAILAVVSMIGTAQMISEER